MKLRLRTIIGLIVAIGVWTALPAAADQVTVTIPPSLSFDVTDITSTTTSNSPTPFTVSYSSAMLASGHSLEMSVHANSADFSAVGGDAIPSDLVAWTVSNVSGGTGSSGTLQTSDSVVFESSPNPSSGSFNVTWKLNALTGVSGLRAGDHSLTITWDLDSI